MDISIKNLGAISEANFTVGDLTVICGKNNTGKTYLTYAVYGFLDFWKRYKPNIFNVSLISNFFKEVNSIGLDCTSLNFLLDNDLKRASSIYSSTLLKNLLNNKNTIQSSFDIHSGFNSHYPKKYSQTIYIEDGGEISLKISNEDNFFLDFDIFVNHGMEGRPSIQEVCNYLDYAIKDFIFPQAAIVSAERTGAALFQREVDFTRSRLIDLMKETSINPQQLLGRFTAEYPLPVKHNIDFIRDLPNIVDKQSEFFVNHPEVIAAFNEIAGGDYTVNAVGGINYTPLNQPDIKLTLAESSSTVRSLVDIGFYLKHLAKQGDLLMIDEPELNLHPENQRKIARLFAMLVNAGIRVFITTHSDYIIKEFNTLLLLNKQDQRIQELAEREGYQTSELLKPEQLNIYMTTLDTNIKDRKAYTLIAANISAENGIELTSFDEVIEDMNRIQDEIVWG